MLKKNLIKAVMLLVCTQQYLMADGAYVKVGVGYGFTANEDVTTDGSDDINFQNQNEVQVSIGYKFESLRVEGEYSYLKVTNDTSTTSTDGDMEINTLSINSIYEFDIGLIFKPFIGVGISASQVRWYLTGADDSDLTFGYQSLVGITMPLDKNVNIDVGYKYSAVGEYTIRGESSSWKISDTVSSSLIVSMRYSF